MNCPLFDDEIEKQILDIGLLGDYAGFIIILGVYEPHLSNLKDFTLQSVMIWLSLLWILLISKKVVQFYWLHFDRIVRIFKPYFHLLLTLWRAELGSLIESCLQNHNHPEHSKVRNIHHK
ncbi:hypothetical protein GQX74_010168 [Glossina fuscipes]|nr:hypothetical protein GQX74_010168 [Glossina fuscipes]